MNRSMTLSMKWVALAALVALVGFPSLAGAKPPGNTKAGKNALKGNTGANNTAVGFQAMDPNAMCTGAGTPNACCTNNIDIGNAGVGGEAATIRIGSGQTATFIAGIFGNGTPGSAVYVNAAGQLSTTPSSARFKDDIQDIGDVSKLLMKLRPVKFRYKWDIDASGLQQYGLIAEEVAKVDPSLVIYGNDGQVETVRYNLVNAMLLNEVQKQARHIEAQERTVKAQAKQIAALTAQTQQIEALTARLTQLEATVSAQGYAPAAEASYKPQSGL